MRALITIFISLLLSGCMTEKKRGDIFHRYAREHKSEVLEYCPTPKDSFKPGVPDTVTRVDTVFTKVPYPVPGTNDTIWVDCPDRETVTRYVERVDTLYRDNAVQLLIVSEKLSEAERRLSYTQGERDQLIKERNRWRNTTYILVAAILIWMILKIWLGSKIKLFK